MTGIQVLLGWGQELQRDMMTILNYIFAVAGSMMIIYAIFLAVNLAKAQDESKRKQAKDRIVKVFASIFIILILLGMVQVFNFWAGT